MLSESRGGGIASGKSGFFVSRREGWFFLRIGTFGFRRQLAAQPFSEHDRRKDEQEDGAGEKGRVTVKGDGGEITAEHAREKSADHEEVFQGRKQRALFLFGEGAERLLGGGSQIARAERGRKGEPFHLAEIIELNGGDKGYESVHEHIGNGMRKKSHDKEHGDLGDEDDAVSLKIAVVFFSDVKEKFARIHADDEQQDGHEIAERGEPVAARKSEREQDEISRLGVGEYAAAGDVGICVEEPSHEAQAEADLQPLIHGEADEFFFERFHAVYCNTAPRESQLKTAHGKHRPNFFLTSLYIRAKARRKKNVPRPIKTGEKGE